MKSIFLLASALALASSTYVKPYHGPLHYTVIGKNGVPVDTAEVQHARAAHLLHKVEAEARNNHYTYAHHEAPLTYSVYELPIISHKGVPLDTKEVAAAKAIHFAAHAKALAGLQHHYRKRRGTHEVTHVYSGPQHYPTIGEKGVPIDTVEVQHARNAHLAHVAAAKSNYGYSNHAVVTPVISHEGSDYVQAYHGPQHLAVIGKNGVPIDTAEVQHARAAHLLHTAEVKARNSGNHNYSPISETYGYSNQNVHVPVVKYVAPYNGKLHFPVIVKGVPVDTVEVQHAKAAHLAAHAAASHGYHY